jgi:hypothetical protein
VIGFAFQCLLLGFLVHGIRRWMRSGSTRPVAVR